MKHINKTALLFALAVMTTPAFAATEMASHDNPMNELEGSTRSALTFGSDQPTKFNIGAGYSRTLMDILQATGEITFNVDSETTDLDLRVGPTFNLAMDDTGIRNAIYLSALGGIKLVRTDAATDTHFAYKGALGKRFEIWKDIAWKPEFNMTGTTAKDSAGETEKPSFALVPVQFAFTF
jgi:hypothetical protein